MSESKELQVVSLDQALALKGKKALEFFIDEKNVMTLIADIEKEVKSFVPNVKTQKGRAEIASLAHKVSLSKKPLKNAIDASIADKEEIVKKAKSVSKLSQSELDRIRDKARAPLNEWEEEQRKIDEARKEAIQLRIAEISALSVYSDQETKEEIGNRIEAIENIEIDESFEEFAQEALKALKDGTAALNARVLQIIEEEQLKEQREQMEEQNKLIEEQERKAKLQEKLNNLAQMPLEYMVKPAKEIREKIEALKDYEPSESVFGDLLEQARASKDNVVVQLGQLLTMAEAKEKSEKEALSVSWIQTSNYVLSQLTSEECEDAINSLERHSNYTGDAIYDEAISKAKAHRDRLLESEKKVMQDRAEAQKSSASNYVDGVAVGIKSPASKKESSCCNGGGCPECSAVMGDATYAEMESGLRDELEMTLQQHVISIATSYACSWGVALTEVEKLEADINKLFD